MEALIVSKLEKLKEELTCVICLDIYNMPISLHNCGHTFCAGCLNKLEDDTRCPMCKCVHFSVNVENSRSVSVQHIVEIYNELAASVASGVSGAKDELKPVKEEPPKRKKRVRRWDDSVYSMDLPSDDEDEDPTYDPHNETTKKRRIKRTTISREVTYQQEVIYISDSEPENDTNDDGDNEFLTEEPKVAIKEETVYEMENFELDDCF